MKNTIALFLIFFFGKLNAQQVNWQYVLRGENQFNPAMNYSCVTADTSGYWASYLAQHVMSYGQAFLGNTDAVHLDFNGNPDDTIHFTGKAHMTGMKSVNDRLYMWVGFFDSVRSGNLLFKSPNNYATWLCYSDNNGLHSVQVFGGDSLLALTILSSGHVAMVTGGGAAQTGTLHVFTPGGSFYETKSLPGIGYAQGIAEAADGGLFITGSCMASAIVLDDVNISNPFTYSNYVLYINSQRKAKWMKFIEDVTCITSAAAGTEHIAYWSGSTFMIPDFGGLNYTGGPGSSFGDFFATRIKSKQFQWVREIPSDTTYAQIFTGDPNSIGMDEEGNVYVLGTIRGNQIHWDAQTKTGNLNNSFNAVIISYDSTGKLRWVRDFGGSGYDEGRQLFVRGVDNLFFSAVLSDSFTLDGKNIPANYGDILLVKIGEESPVSNRDISADFKLRIFPNPGEDRLWHNASKPLPFEIFNCNGKKMMDGIMLPGEYIHTAKLPSGMYLLRAGDTSGIWVKSN